MDSVPLFIILFITLIATYFIVRFAAPKNCPFVKEGFAPQNDPSINACPKGSTEYITKDEQILCCTGKVEGDKCYGEILCRRSNAEAGNSIPHCSNYNKTQMFNIKESLIQNPDTNMCLMPLSNKENSIGAVECVATDKNQLWTYNELGQLQHHITKLCMTEYVDSISPYIKRHVLGSCGMNNSQKYTYDFKTNTIGVKSSPGKSIFVQDNKSNKKINLVLTQMTDDEIKTVWKKQTGKEMDKKSLDNIKNLFYSNSKRTTFLGVRPTLMESVSILQDKYKI